MSESDYFPKCQYTGRPTYRKLSECPDGTRMVFVIRDDGHRMHAHVADEREVEELKHTLDPEWEPTFETAKPVRKRKPRVAVRQRKPRKQI